MGKERERREEREKRKSRIHHHLAPALVFQIETFLSDLRAKGMEDEESCDWWWGRRCRIKNSLS